MSDWGNRAGTHPYVEVPSQLASIAEREQRVGTYEDLGRDIGRLVSSKQKQYGRAGDKAAEVMRVLYPYGIAVHQLVDALTMVRIIDKLSRIAQRGPDGRDLGGESPYRDIAGYGLIGAERDDGIHRE